MRILGVTAPERVPAYDAPPTFAEQGTRSGISLNLARVLRAPRLPEEQLTATMTCGHDDGNPLPLPNGKPRARRMGSGQISTGPGDDFTAFLETQEKQLGDLMRDLGFL